MGNTFNKIYVLCHAVNLFRVPAAFLNSLWENTISTQNPPNLTFAVHHIRASNLLCAPESRLLTDPTILFYAGVGYWRRHFWGVLAFTDILSLSSGHTSTPHQVKIVFVGTHSKWVILFQKLLSMCVWVARLIICVDYWSTQVCGDLPNVFLPVLVGAQSSLVGLTTTFLTISR